jgi:hypothetical protein
MTRDEAYKILRSARDLYQPIMGFGQASKKDYLSFALRINAIADYCGHEDYYLVGGCANGFSCFELAILGAKVVGVDNCTGRRCENSLEIARATAVYYKFPPYNPKFILGDFPGYFYYTEERPHWTVLMMVLHNMLKSMPVSEIYKMIDQIWSITLKGFVMTTRGAISPKQIIDNTKYEKFEEIPSPKGTDGKRNIAFGFPIWVFT